MLRVAYVGLIFAVGLALPVMLSPDTQPVNSVEQKPEKWVAVSKPAPKKQIEFARETGIAGRQLIIHSDNRGHYVTNFRLNGRNVEALVDTGATTVAINYDTARRIGLTLSESDFKYSVNTANGTTKAAAVMIDSIEVGRIHVRGVQAAVLRDNALSGTLIGMSFLNKLKSFQVSNGRLTLEQ